MGARFSCIEIISIGSCTIWLCHVSPSLTGDGKQLKSDFPEPLKQRRFLRQKFPVFSNRHARHFSQRPRSRSNPGTKLTSVVVAG